MRVFHKVVSFSVLFFGLFVGLLGTAQTLPNASFDDAVLESYRVHFEVENQIANVTIEQTYSNPTDIIMEETYIFPVPKGTTITSLTLCQGDEACTEGQLLNAEQARSIYEEIVRRTRDPALLEYLDDRSFQVRVYPILPGEKQTIKIRYQQILNRQNDLIQVLYPITSQKRIGQMFIDLVLKNDQPIGNVYSPSHGISINRVSEHEVKASFEASNLNSDEDFLVYYAVTQDGIALDMISFQPTGEDGYFLMLMSWPKVESEPLAKEIVFVLDTSGSMDGEKMEQAKEALRFAMQKLNPSDRVGIVTFSDTIREYKSDLVEASQLNKLEVMSFIDGLTAAGGTNIHSALLRGLELFDETSEFPKMVVFLTDGLPTAGETDVSRILKDFENGNGKLNGRIFTFGVGYDVNTILLDTLSGENGGFTTYVEPSENLESAVSQFYNRVGTPVLWSLQSKFEGLDVYDIYPVALPDLFDGDMLEVVGRYRAGGKGSLSVTGQGSEMTEAFSHDIELAAGWTEHDYLPKIWAARAVGYLLTQIRLHGSSDELVNRVRELGEKYGIVTPYTSYLAAPDQDDATGFFSMPSQAAPSGQGAVQASEALNLLSKATSADEFEQFYTYTEKKIGDATYQLREGRWVNQDLGGADQPKADVVIEFGSEAYFALADNSEMRDILKLGSNVIFQVKSDYGKPTTVEVADSGIKNAADLPANLRETAQNGSQQNNTSQNDPEQTLKTDNTNANQNQNQNQTQPEATAETAMPWATIAIVAAILALLAAVGFVLIRR